jgi:hypothetical protein
LSVAVGAGGEESRLVVSRRLKSRLVVSRLESWVLVDELVVE